MTNFDQILKNKKNSSKLPSICWEKGDVKYDGIPYIQLGVCSFQCHQGEDFNIGHKKKHKEKQEQKLKSDHAECFKMKKLSQPSKKVGCPVKFDVKKLLKFDGFKISDDTRYLRRSTASKLKDTIAERLAKGDTQITTNFGKVIYVVSFPQGNNS